jgi:RNA polymerase sigma factor (sigma-70 family)
MKKSKPTAAELIATWKTSGLPDLDDDLRAAVSDIVRRQIGVIVRQDGLRVPIDSNTLTTDLTASWTEDLEADRKETLALAIASTVNAILVEREPKEFTRWLWAWDRQAPNAKEVEQQLFTAIKEELDRELKLVLRRQRFSNLHHKIEPGDLTAELFIKLAKAKIPRLPQDRRQFLNLVDKAMVGVLVDMQKAKARRPKTAGNVVLELHADTRTGQNHLRVLLEAEKLEKMEELLKTLPERQQEAFRLRRSGLKTTEITTLIGVSKAQVDRYISQTITFLRDAFSADH